MSIFFSVHRTGSQWLLWSQTGGPNCRFISSQEVATALRPFYFVVHPDLFGQFPEQRVSLIIFLEIFEIKLQLKYFIFQATNEDSLQTLSAHLEALNQYRILQTTPNTLPFYVRATDAEKRSNFRLVNVPLEKSLDAKRVIKRILEGKVCFFRILLRYC